jgi:PAS domain-containing protein
MDLLRRARDPATEERGEPIGPFGMAHAITECPRVEAVLLASARRFRAIFNQGAQFTGLLKPDGTVLELNQAALDFWRLQLSEAGRGERAVV